MKLEDKIMVDEKGNQFRYGYLTEGDPVYSGDEVLLSTGKWQKTNSLGIYKRHHNKKRRKFYLSLEDRMNILEEKVRKLNFDLMLVRAAGGKC